MTDCDAMLAAVRESPQDCTLRLAYADALDEVGDHVHAAIQRVLTHPDRDDLRLHYADACEAAGDADRAEFVRVQVEWSLSRCRETRDGLERRMGGLVTAYIDSRINPSRGVRREPIPPLPDTVKGLVYAFDHTPDYGEDRCFVRRGFVDSVRCTAAIWIQHGDAILERHPVREVVLTTWPQWVTTGNPDSSLLRLNGRGEWRDIPYEPGVMTTRTRTMTRLLALEWPGVKFTMPTTPAAGTIMFDAMGNPVGIATGEGVIARSGFIRAAR